MAGGKKGNRDLEKIFQTPSYDIQSIYNARLVVLPGAGHGIYSGAAMRTACKEIEDFVTKKEKLE